MMRAYRACGINYIDILAMPMPMPMPSRLGDGAVAVHPFGEERFCQVSRQRLLW